MSERDPETTPEPPHPDYGPCDGFGPNGDCSECTGMIQRVDGSVLPVAHAADERVVWRNGRYVSVSDGKSQTTLPPYVTPSDTIDPHSPMWRRHPYGVEAWQDIMPDGEVRIYPTREAAAADGAPYAKKAVGEGKPLSLLRPTPIAVLRQGDPGYWKLSDECRRDLEEIERAIIRR